MPRGSNIVIAEGQTDSTGVIDVRDVAVIFIHAPATVAGEVKPVFSTTSGGTYNPLQSPAGTDIVIAASKIVGIQLMKAFSYMKLRSSVVAGAGGETYHSSIGIP